MNFLAHIFLSGNNPSIQIGNFIGDFVKGKEIEEFPDEIQSGIMLHRKIDEYTDQHPVVLQSKIRLRPMYHHYSPVIVDVYYDHFLAKYWQSYHELPLKDFTLRFYKMTEDFSEWLPSRTQNILHYMRSDDWLFNYQYVEGIDRALSGMARRTRFTSKMEHASESLKENYTSFREEFSLFFPDLQKVSKDFIDNL